MHAQAFTECFTRRYAALSTGDSASNSFTRARCARRFQGRHHGNSCRRSSTAKARRALVSSDNSRMARNACIVVPTATHRSAITVQILTACSMPQIMHQTGDIP